MRKTKKQIMEEIYEYADNKEVTKSTIRKYLIEELKMSRSSAYRFLNKSDEEEIEIKNRETKKRDDIEYSEKEYEEIVSKCYEIIHSKYGLKSNDMITLKLAKSIAEDAGVNCRWLCCNILGMNTNNYDKLERGNSKTSKISIGLGFKNPEISQRVKELKHELICTKLGEKFSLQDIQDLAEEKEIPMQIILEKVFCLTRDQLIFEYAQYMGLFRDEFPDRDQDLIIRSISKVEIVNLDEPKDYYCVELCDKNIEPYFLLPNGNITHNCRLKNKIQTKEFNFTNGNLGINLGPLCA